MRKRRRERCRKEGETCDFIAMEKEAERQFSCVCAREQESKEGEKEDSALN